MCWWARRPACTAGGSAGRPACTSITPPTSAPTTARSACCPLPGRGLRASLPSRQEQGRGRTVTVGGCRAQLPLTVLCPQVQRDYLQGKLLVGAQADALVARLAALQLVSRTHEAPLSE